MSMQPSPPITNAEIEVDEVGPLLYELNRKLGIPLALESLGFPPDGAAETARIACDSPYDNPRPFERAPIE